jgi:hypothetical protein
MGSGDNGVGRVAVSGALLQTVISGSVGVLTLAISGGARMAD